MQYTGEGLLHIIESKNGKIAFVICENETIQIFCGTPLQVFLTDEWINTRLEAYVDCGDYYLVNIKVPNIEGLTVRVHHGGLER